MSDPENRPNEILHFCQEFWRAPQSLMPGQAFAEQFSKAAQEMVAAQVSYAQNAMSMNAKFMEFWFDKKDAAAPVHVAEDEKARERLAI